MKHFHINEYIKKIKPYKTASHKIWEIEDKNSVLKLDWNEATIPPSPRVIKRMKELTASGDFYNLYPSYLNDKIINLLSNYTDLPKENIQYFASSDSLHEYISRVYISLNDKVLIQSPSYDNFRLTVEADGAQIYFSEIDNDFFFNAEKFEEDIIKIKPSLVYICNPNNPIGYIHSVSYINSLIKKYSDIMFVLDEAYIEFSGGSAKDLVLENENILITRTLSKAFALANFRFGYLIASEENIQNVSKIRNPKNINTFTQEAVIEAFFDIEYMKAYVEEVKKSRNYFIAENKKHSKYMKLYDSNANFVTIRFNNFDFKRRFINVLAQKNIYIRDLSHRKLLTNSVRITIGTLEQMKKVTEVINNFLERG